MNQNDTLSSAVTEEGGHPMGSRRRLHRCHSKYREFAEEVLEFLRETVPVRWSEFRDSVTDNFRVIDPRDFRVLK
jgi:hypothetical protein